MKRKNDFLLGAATAAHQVEGNNTHSDYWVMEHVKHSDFVEPSGDAVDHYNRYEEDIALLAGAGLNAYRFSIEWARVEGGEAQAVQLWQEDFGFYLPYIAGDDFLGVQNYSRKIVDARGAREPASDAPLTQMGYEDYPASIGHVLRKVAKEFHGDLLVTENGIGTDDAARRCAFLREAFAGVRACVEDGLPVKGYFCWSLLDNFEWQAGYAKTFGLITVDRATQTRHPKESLAVLGTLLSD